MAKLAKTIINYSLVIKKGDKLLIDVSDLAIPLAKEIIRETYLPDGIPIVSIKSSQISKLILENAGQDHLELMANIELPKIKTMDAYLGILAIDNDSENAEIPIAQQKMYKTIYSKPLTDYIVNNTKWCFTRYPTPSLAQSARMSTEFFEEFYFQACNLDYDKLTNATEILVELMARTSEVKIIGPNTELVFCIKNQPVIPCIGKNNIPDGEIYTAPDKYSINGSITYNIPSNYSGVTLENIQFDFKDGKIINAKCNDSKKLNEILDTDDGARYIGEFSLGINYNILKPTGCTLFDEKVCGSFHLTPGQAYKNCDNGNNSAIHWDLVSIQLPEYGGGEIYFDNLLIRKDGYFTIPELSILNPHNSN